MNTKAEYREFLKSSFWRKISANKKASVGGRCEICTGIQALECHHVRYPKNWYETDFDDLVVLCRGCHLLEHFYPETEYEWERFSKILRITERGRLERVIKWYKLDRDNWRSRFVVQATLQCLKHYKLENYNWFKKALKGV